MKTDQEIADAFEKAAASGRRSDGGLEKEGFLRALQLLDLQNVQEAEAEELLRTIDKDGSGTVSLNELRDLFHRAALRRIFESIDRDGSGTIEEHELQTALALFDVHLAKHEIETMMHEVDKSEDGLVSFEEFFAFFDKLEDPSLRSVAQSWVHTCGIDIGSDLTASLPPQHMPLWRFLIAGGIGGCFSRTMTAPLEKVKIEAQTSTSPVRILSSLATSYSRSGIKGLFAGNGANCLRVFPMAGLTCVAYSQLLQRMPGKPKDPLRRLLCGQLAGAVGVISTYPLDTIRARMTVKDGNSGILSTAKAIVKEGGMRRLYAGMGPTLLAVMPFVGIQQATYDALKMLLFDSGAVTPSVPLFLACGAIAGTAAQGVVYPLDVVRRRMQLGADVGQRATFLSTYTWTALRRVVQMEGFASLYSGITATFAKVAPAVAFSVVARDAVLGRV